MSDANAGAGIRFAQLATADGGFIGRVTLAVPSTLNSLTLDMVDAFSARLDDWESSAGLRALWIEGEGDRAMCAGGDVQALHHSCRANHDAGERIDTYAEDFFEREYRLDYRLHMWRTPVVVWGQGIVMGGGLGFFSAGSHRIVGARSRIAMPEITIGLFPDAGGTALLCGIPDGIGLFLGLTGAQVGATDACHFGVATHAIDAGARSAVIDALTAARWSGDAGDNRRRLTAWLNGLALTYPFELPVAPLREHAERIAGALAGADDAATRVAALVALQGRDEWLDKAIGNLVRGCPMTAAIVGEQLARGEALRLADKFRQELVIGVACARHTDFAEGVRALLIDKDGAPQWRHGGFEDVTQADLDAHFKPPWTAHPLDDLGASE